MRRKLREKTKSLLGNKNKDPINVSIPYFLLISIFIPQNWFAESNSCFVCNQFTIAYVLSDLFEYQPKYFLLFI